MLLEKCFVALTLISTLLNGGQTIEEKIETAEVPILMYHQISDKNFNDVTISENKFKEQMKYLNENNYNTISIEDMIAYVEEGAALPENAVCITFDDGYLSNYEIAYPVLKKYNMKATIFVIGSSVGKEKYKETSYDIIPHFTYEEAREMEESGIIDIESHTYDMHQSFKYEDSDAVREDIAKLESDTEIEYILALENDFKMIQNEFSQNLGKNITALAYPHGKVDATAALILKQLGIKVTFTTEPQKAKLERENSDSLYELGRFNVSEYTTMEEFETFLK